ncbi:D-2-hydroxyacid dehydrogenase [Flammeovirga sp. SubArs3]|uniref:D-2-hydroxyacid dehydrogenase n=1 Tax=Flammeovirga sp. SubArs3 TaxID=2995316 RepID=UPI00248AB802|nr:D-2-hydroxyacid dehydrogenase [Flammeovirga sp. SubArs3]
MKIVFLDTETLGSDVKPQLDTFSKLGDVTFYDSTLAAQLQDRVENAHVIVTNKVLITEEVMKASSQLKLIAITATGTNNVDLEAANNIGIQVKNAVNYSSESVAQQTFAMLLSLLNNIQEYDDFVKSGSYSDGQSFTWIGNSFSELNNKRFGIIGLGNIGTRVAEIATAFGAEVVYYSTSGIARDKRYQLVDKDTLFKTCDIISIHSPLNDKTKNFVDENELSQMKPSAVLLNTGRGGIVNEKALVNALNNNEISGACVDVFEKEPMSKDSVFYSINNKKKVLFSPHIAWASKEARKKLLEITYQNVEEFVIDTE